MPSLPFTSSSTDWLKELFEADARLSDHYNRVFAGGKWNHFADQVHIGYTMWNDPPRNTRYSPVAGPVGSDAGDLP